MCVTYRLQGGVHEARVAEVVQAGGAGQVGRDQRLAPLARAAAAAYAATPLSLFTCLINKAEQFVCFIERANLRNNWSDLKKSYR